MVIGAQCSVHNLVCSEYGHTQDQIWSCNNCKTVLQMVDITNVILLWREVWIGTVANNYTKWIYVVLHFPLNAQHLELGY